MDQLTLRPRKALVEEPIESWDDDDLDIGGDDFTFRSASLATTSTSNHRESISSRMSMRSDFDSNHGDEEKQVHVPGDDERSTHDAIATATRAGIPIPANVPASALMGGTIKRLGGRKLKKIIQDDWDDGDFEVPGEGALKIKRPDASNFPDAIRQVSGGSTQASPAKSLQAASMFNLSPRQELKPKPASSNLLLDRYRDQEDDDFFGDSGDTIKVSKSRQVPKLQPLITPPTPQKGATSLNPDDDFERDFHFPSSNGHLRLSDRSEAPKTPASLHDDLDDWGEGGSLGTRHAGKRDRSFNRSSSVTALSPSVASSITIESEDEGLDGLVLPSGPLHFNDILKRRQQDRSPDHQSNEKQAAKRAEVKEDFLTGLEIGDGDVFDSSKLTLNRNIKMKSARQTSPVRPKTAVSLTFTNKPAVATSTSTHSRLPRPLGGHERVPSSLEPVSETGGPILKSTRRSQSRLGHSSQSSITSIATPTTPSSNHSLPPSTPRRRDVASKLSNTALRTEATTTHAQLLKVKRSMPTMRTGPQSPAKPMVSRYERPPSRTDNGRPNSMSRPKTPVERDRSGAESSMSHARKNHVPFLPAGGTGSQSHHVAIKTSRHFRRHDSESSNASIEFRPSSRTVSRTTMRSPSPRRRPEVLAREAASKRTLTKPVRRRHFGDGNELDGFDDLPTSRDSEAKFVKEPVGRGPPKLNTLRNKVHQDILPARTTTPAPLYSPARPKDELPRFARDTNASRMAREHSLAHRAPSTQGAPLAALTSQWKAKVAATTGLSAVHAQPMKPKKIKGPPQKPQLIKPLGNLNNPKRKFSPFHFLTLANIFAGEKGMYYNPHTWRWEGNEHDLTAFDAPVSSPSAGSMPPHTFREKDMHQVYREKENTTPRPALIQNVNSAHNVQIVGGMVFDPQRMCWLKLPGQGQRNKSDAGDTMDGFDAFDDEEDVFKDVPDLEDPVKEPSEVGGGRKSEGASGLKDDWLVGEEFDVGPEFVRRQREEEERWRRKCEKWVGAGLERGGEEWRWSIRDVVNEL